MMGNGATRTPSATAPTLTDCRGFGLAYRKFEACSNGSCPGGGWNNFKTFLSEYFHTSWEELKIPEKSSLADQVARCEQELSQIQGAWSTAVDLRFLIPSMRGDIEATRIDDAAAAENARRAEEAKLRGPEYAKKAETHWSIEKKKNEMTDRVEIEARSLQETDSGILAEVRGACAGDGKIAFFALLTDRKGEPSLTFARSSGYEQVQYRVNDEQPVRITLQKHQFANQFTIALLHYSEEGDKSKPSAVRMSLGGSVVDNPLDAVWRLLVQFDTSLGQIVVKVPMYDDAIQQMASACQRRASTSQ